MIEEILTAVVGILVILFIVWLSILLPMKMAKKRGRSPLGWVFIFWLITPLWGIIILLIVGDSQEKLRQKIIEELRHQ